MKKQISKIICATVAAALAGSIAVAAAGCSPYHKGEKLSYTPSANAATSNGGFAVEKDGYIYFINGTELNTAENKFGKPVKGSIMRISVNELDKGNYSSAEMVVPQIAYSSESTYSAGIFVYGDYIYYGTPSTTRNSNGEIQSESLEMKSTKLDGTESMKDSYVTFPSTAYNYRFVEENGVVYLLYVATAETLYEETSGVTNLHSYNTKTGEDTLLAYNIASYMFDAEDKTNPQVYYTMNVYDYNGTTNTAADYNQVYTVKASATQQKEYDVSGIIGWDEENDRYINCGDLVFDGIGGMIYEATPFNDKTASTAVNTMAYKYTLKSYLNDTLFYTRTEVNVADSHPRLFALKDSELTADRNAIKANPEDDLALMDNGSNAGNFKYIFDEKGDLLSVLAIESSGGISVTKVVDGKINEKNDKHLIVRSGSATMLFVDGDYLYYSISGNGTNGYSFYRVNHTGEWGDYEGMFPEDEVTPYTPVRILDLDAASDWYKPELIGDYIIFCSQTDNMVTYSYVMAFDLKLADSNGDKVIENKEIAELNDLYFGVIGDDGDILKYNDTEKYPEDKYANLANAARYLFYTGDIDTVKQLAADHNALLEEEEDEDATPVYSENTLKKLEDFLAVEGDWVAYKETSRQINGQEIYANRRDYYYSVIGKMTEEDAESYANDFVTDNLVPLPEKEEEPTWYQTLPTVSRVFFIIGMCLAGILVIAGCTVLTLWLVRRSRNNKLPNYTKRRIKVDTTDDKNINVYEDESAVNKEEAPQEENEQPQE